MTFDHTNLTSDNKDDQPLIEPQGFREYDARWLFPQEINHAGIRLFGAALGIFYQRRSSRRKPTVIVGHDWRSYSLSVKQSLAQGLIDAGCIVCDIGLTLSPIAYFAQQDLGFPFLAMVTASHNENGWTGVKMSYNPPVTLLPDDIQEIRHIVLEREKEALFFCENHIPGPHYHTVSDITARYLQDVTARGKQLKNAFKVVVSCGNGTAGAFAPDALRRIGVEVIEQNCELDYTFPHHNPNPEDMRMLQDLSTCVQEHGADMGFAFDGDGDRCGIVGPDGQEIFSDKLGVLLARYLALSQPQSRIVVDVKSTNLFSDDPVLLERGIATTYWKTGHSYMKEKIMTTEAIAGFEKSGHMFFAPPFGRGYDDGILAAIMTLRMCDDVFPKSIAQLYQELTPTWSSPTMAPFCSDDRKYDVVDRIREKIKNIKINEGTILGQPIEEIIDINGVRVVLHDGTWGLIRASSNKPSLVVVVESRHSRDRMLDMFSYLNELLKEEECVGQYDQALTLL